MTNMIYLDHNGATPVCVETFEVNGKNVHCITRDKDVAVRMEVAHDLRKQGVPFKDAMMWAQTGELHILNQYLIDIITNDAENVKYRSDIYALLLGAGYTLESILQWTVFGNPRLLKGGAV